jgi:hypothetical protein
MDTVYQEKAIEAVRDWCKWLIGLNFSSVTGCAIVVERGADAALQPFLFGAILLFALSAVVAALVLGILPSMVQRLPLHDRSGALQNIYTYHVWEGITLGRLIRLQFGLFVLAIPCFLTWVAFK